MFLRHLVPFWSPLSGGHWQILCPEEGTRVMTQLRNITSRKLEMNIQSQLMGWTASGVTQTGGY